MVDTKASFTGSIPEYYDGYLGPAWFDVYAEDLAGRLQVRPPGDVLEIACGTGLLTRRLRRRLDPAVVLTATDLSKTMLDYARGKLGEVKGLEWREADAVDLPFGDAQFGAVVCSFGFMFVPDRKAAFRQARRVLKAGGTLLFNVWDRMEDNPHSVVIAALIEELFPGDEEMRFRMPFDMHDPALLRNLLAETGFRGERIEHKRFPIDGISARRLAVGAIRGTPRSLLFEKRGVPLDEMIEKLTAALAKSGGADPYRGHAQAVIVEARAV